MVMFLLLLPIKNDDAPSPCCSASISISPRVVVGGLLSLVLSSFGVGGMEKGGMVFKVSMKRLGCGEGAVLGTNEDASSSVGDEVGIEEGILEGTSDGIFDGTVEGKAEGSTEGMADGVSEG